MIHHLEENGISQKPPRPPRPPRPTTLESRPSTLDFSFFIVFFYRSNYKIRETIAGQCWLTVCDAGLTLSERLVYVSGGDTIHKINMRGLDKAKKLPSESHHYLPLTLAQHCSIAVIAKHSQHEALNQCWFNAGQTFATMAQRLRCRCQCV